MLHSKLKCCTIIHVIQYMHGRDTVLPSTVLTLTTGDVHLTAHNSSTSVLSEGRVEVFYSGIWGGICTDGWDLNGAEVVCRQLGFPDAMEAVNDTMMGNGTSPPPLTDVQCNGSEEHLRRECTFSEMEANQNCTHSEAGVVCQGTLCVRNIIIDSCAGKSLLYIC